ncbi:hypothetical protein BC830DRAFT_859389 [Chytriomyces sp. MP71]|nr:hypothetical protein BC830DRAFT_859389 [Chytriomyces sp. MP71]
MPPSLVPLLAAQAANAGHGSDAQAREGGPQQGKMPSFKASRTHQQPWKASFAHLASLQQNQPQDSVPSIPHFASFLHEAAADGLAAPNQMPEQPADASSNSPNLALVIPLVLVAVLLLLGGLALFLWYRKQSVSVWNHPPPSYTKSAGVNRRKSKTFYNRSPLSPSLGATPTQRNDVGMVYTSYIKNMPDEITVVEGDVVQILTRFDDGWTKVCLTRTGAVGMVPLATMDKPLE